MHIGASGNRELLTAADFNAHAKDDAAKVKNLKTKETMKKYILFAVMTALFPSMAVGQLWGNFVNS